jgi:hypothetical protein
MMIDQRVLDNIQEKHGVEYEDILAALNGIDA